MKHNPKYHKNKMKYNKKRMRNRRKRIVLFIIIATFVVGVSKLKFSKDKEEVKTVAVNQETNLESSGKDNVQNEAGSTTLDSSNTSGDNIKEKENEEEKTTDIKTKQQEDLNKKPDSAKASSSASTTTMSLNNINTLNIQSNTSYLINVDIQNQKTYIYKGKVDNWQLVKECQCSTGVSGKETPSGTFTTKEKGDWFFSEKYKQGGKYWTQINGNILFHSVPFAKDRSTILDYTMDKPSSHGCIRLSVDDSKWMYNNIPRGTKVIVK